MAAFKKKRMSLPPKKITWKDWQLFKDYCKQDVATRKEQIEALLPELDNLIAWAKAVQDHALKQALEGVNYNGFKLVEVEQQKQLENTLKSNLSYIGVTPSYGGTIMSIAIG